MDINNLTLFSAVKKRMNWITQRQEVLAQNIANADTPDYQAKDLKDYNFKELIAKESMHVSMSATNSGHIVASNNGIVDYYKQSPAYSYETSPSGNSVVLEEQMQKVNEATISHTLTTQLYSKHLKMLRTALGR